MFIYENTLKCIDLSKRPLNTDWSIKTMCMHVHHKQDDFLFWNKHNNFVNHSGMCQTSAIKTTAIKATINAVKCKYVFLNSYHSSTYPDKGFIGLLTNDSG